MPSRRSTRIVLAPLPIDPSDRGGSLGSPASSKVAGSSVIKQTSSRLSSALSSSREGSPARQLFPVPSSSSSYVFGSPRSVTPRLADLPSTDPPSPFLVTALRSPTPFPPGSPNAFVSSSSGSSARNASSSTPTRFSRRLNHLPPPPPPEPTTPSTSTGPGTAGCGFVVYSDDEPVNGADPSSSLPVAASPAPSATPSASALDAYQPDKENKVPVVFTSLPFIPSPLKRRRDLDVEQLQEEDDDDEESPVASSSTGSPVKGGLKGKGRELNFVVEEKKEEEPMVTRSKGKGKEKAGVVDVKGKGRAILELEADEGDLVADDGLELTPGRKVPIATVVVQTKEREKEKEKTKVCPPSPKKKTRAGQ